MKKNIINRSKGSIILFCFGILSLIIGFNGEMIAIKISSDPNASSSFTSGAMINSFTYIPIFIAIFLFILSIVVFSKTFNNHQ